MFPQISRIFGGAGGSELPETTAKLDVRLISALILRFKIT